MANTVLNVVDGQNVTVDATKLILSPSNDTSGGCRALDAHAAGKYVFEMTPTVAGGAGDFLGVCSAGAQIGPAPTVLQSAGDFSANAQYGMAHYKGGSCYVNGASQTPGGSAFSAGVPCMLCVDLDNKKVWGIQGGVVFPSGGNPATNTGGYDISSICGGGVYPCFGMTTGVTNGQHMTVNFGDSGFTNTVPTGFTAGWPVNTDVQLDAATGRFTEFTVSGSSSTFPLKTSGTNRVVGFLFYTEKGSNAAATTISGVTDTAGLVWNKRKQVGFNDGVGGDLEIWWAAAAAQLTGDTATITLNAATDHGVVYSFGVVNGNLTSPFDANVALPATNHASSSTPSVPGVSTTAAKSLLIALCGDPAATEGGTDTANGFAPIGGFNSHAGGIDWADVFVQTKAAQAALSSVTVSGGTLSGTQPWGMIVDAFVAAPSSANIVAAPSLGVSMSVVLADSMGIVAPALGLTMAATLTEVAPGHRQPVVNVVN